MGLNESCQLLGSIYDGAESAFQSDRVELNPISLYDRATLMSKRKTEAAAMAFDRTLAGHKDTKYVLRLYVTGMTPKSMKAIANVKKICEEYLIGRYELEVIDIYQQPKLAEGEQIVAAPTLIKKLPLPLRKLIGDMSDTEKFLFGIDLQPKKAQKEAQ